MNMLLFRPFLTHSTLNAGLLGDDWKAAVGKCIISAQKTIEIVYEAYKVHTYFQTWYVPTTPYTNCGPLTHGQKVV